MANTIWYVGDRPRITIQITDESGVLTDPDALVVKVKSPAGAVTTWTYPTSTEIARDGVGLYHFYIDLVQATTWCYRVEATGALTVAKEGAVEVERSNFYLNL